VTPDLALPSALLEALGRTRHLVVLTGAGTSAESGVPVFRGAGGLWEGFRPEDLATPEAFARDPVRVWRWYRWRLERVQAAEPHAGHRALARLEASNRLRACTLVTQNVDGLHQRAGSRLVLELHGNITRSRCTSGCGVARPAETVDPERAECPCGSGMLRPDVVWFGESLDPGVLGQASLRIEEADMVWVVGTSALVHPAAGLPGIALQRGIPVVEVNPERTPLSGAVPYSLRRTAAEGVPALVEGILGPRTNSF